MLEVAVRDVMCGPVHCVKILRARPSLVARLAEVDFAVLVIPARVIAVRMMKGGVLQQDWHSVRVHGHISEAPGDGMVGRQPFSWGKDSANTVVVLQRRGMDLVRDLPAGRHDGSMDGTLGRVCRNDTCWRVVVVAGMVPRRRRLRHTALAHGREWKSFAGAFGAILLLLLVASPEKRTQREKSRVRPPLVLR